MNFKELEKELNDINGHIGFYYKNLIDNNHFAYNEEQLFLAASIIKFPILCVIYKWVNENKVDLNEYIVVKDKDKLPSCGALRLFSDEPRVNVQTLCNLMISISDNSATNILLNKYGIDNFNTEFKNIGLHNTHIERLLFDSEASKKGLENKVVPKELGELLEKIYKREFVSEEVSDNIIDILLTQQINHKVSILKSNGIKVAHKTGEDDGISNDVGIVLCDKPFVFCFLGNNTDTTKFENFIRKTSYELL